jgi:hypothetical protein
MRICSAVAAVQGCAAEIDDGKPLISEQGENHVLAAPPTSLIAQASQDGFIQHFPGCLRRRGRREVVALGCRRVLAPGRRVSDVIH